MLPPEARLPEVVTLVERHQYFVLHAARQTGKTTTMRAFAARLRESGVAAVYATLETCQGVDAVATAETLMLAAIQQRALADLPAAFAPPPLPPADVPGQRLNAWLSVWANAITPVPLVLFLDEADAVRGEPVINFFCQLRAGFPERPARFPASIALIGLRDLRDYLTAANDGTPVNPGSPFNDKSKSLTLRSFTLDEVGQLYAQHTADTGQVFLPEAVDRAFHWSQGQPFLVNALGATCTDDLVTDRSVSITADHVDHAKERLVLSRTTHLHNLAERLKESRVAPIISRLLTGAQDVPVDSDDFEYCTDLGLLDGTARPARVANPLYREVIVRELSLRAQGNLTLPCANWRRADGSLDAEVLVTRFLRWWRENADVAVDNNPDGYAEALVHLTFMAYLQKVVNGGGQIAREYAAGTGRVDLCIDMAGRRAVIELKRVRPTRDSLERVTQDGIVQLCEYLDTLGEREGWLIVFDQRPGLGWDERLWEKELQVEGRTLHVRGA